MDTCNATERFKGRLMICEKPLGHLDNHRDGDHEWTQPRLSGGPNERILER